jgi:hypothetical protein
VVAFVLEGTAFVADEVREAGGLATFRLGRARLDRVRPVVRPIPARSGPGRVRDFLHHLVE